MRKVMLALSVLVGSSAVANSSEAFQEPLVCTQGKGMFRVWEHLVFAHEECEYMDLNPPDVLVLFLQRLDNPKKNCENMGGRYERIGPTPIAFHICWDVDY